MTPATKLEGGSSSKRIKDGQANKRPIKWGHKVFSQLTVIWTNPKDRKFRTHLSSEAWPNLLIFWPLSACPLQPPPTHTQTDTHTHQSGPLQHHNKMKVHYSERKDQARQNGVPPTNFPALSIKWWRLENHLELFTYLAGGVIGTRLDRSLPPNAPCEQLIALGSKVRLLTQVELRILWFLGGFNPSEKKCQLEWLF